MNYSYNVGDVVVQAAFGGGRRFVRVDEKEIIKGRPGFSGIPTDSHGNPVESEYGVWGYDSQILDVIKNV